MNVGQHSESLIYECISLSLYLARSLSFSHSHPYLSLSLLLSHSPTPLSLSPPPTFSLPIAQADSEEAAKKLTRRQKRCQRDKARKAKALSSVGPSRVVQRGGGGGDGEDTARESTSGAAAVPGLPLGRWLQELDELNETLSKALTRQREYGSGEDTKNKYGNFFTSYEASTCNECNSSVRVLDLAGRMKRLRDIDCLISSCGEGPQCGC
jgi:hypothetical protein